MLAAMVAPALAAVRAVVRQAVAPVRMVHAAMALRAQGADVVAMVGAMAVVAEEEAMVAAGGVTEVAAPAAAATRKFYVN